MNILSITRTITRAVRATLAPTTLYTPDAPAPAPDTYSPDTMPDTHTIEQAAAAYATAADNARRADRGKRAARKILDRLPAGHYGAWTIERAASSRQTADLDQIRAIFKAHGLGPIPMKTSAPSLRVIPAPSPTLAPTREKELAA